MYMYLFDLLDLGLSDELRLRTVPLDALDRVSLSLYVANYISIHVCVPFRSP